MHFPFRLDFSGGLTAAGLEIKNDATLIDSRLGVDQIVYLDEIEVIVKIVLVIDADTIIRQATPHLNEITTEVRGEVKDPKKFNKKLDKILKQGCKNLVGIDLKPGRKGVGSVRKKSKEKN